MVRYYPYYGGAVLGLAMFIYGIWRDGLKATAAYWNDESDPMCPAGSMTLVSRLQRGYYNDEPPMSKLALVWGVWVAFFASILGGLLVGSFLMMFPVALIWGVDAMNK